MEELSIEKKAKRYDLAIEAAKSIYNNMEESGNFGGIEDLEVIFPEIAKSEDERMFKAIAEGIRDEAEVFGWSDFGDIPIDDILAWLEKQREKTSDKIVEKARTEKQRVLLTETDGNANIDWDCRSINDVKILLKCGLEFIRNIEANKQILTDNRFGDCSFRVPTWYNEGINQGEQKSTDKFEPKFKVGDWMCATDDDGNKHLCRVASVEYDSTNDRDDYTIDFNGTGYSPEWPDVLFDCEPILLTPEILEKNGFENKKGRFMQIGNFDNPPLIMWHLVDDIILGHPKFQLEIHYGGKSMHVSFVCRYVHELQHALRLCNIDKEIKLED